jgi:hypothetical protein
MQFAVEEASAVIFAAYAAVTMTLLPKIRPANFVVVDVGDARLNGPGSVNSLYIPVVKSGHNALKSDAIIILLTEFGTGL